MNPLDVLEFDIDFFYIIAVLFGVVSLVGLVFVIILRYHFKRFNLRHDTKGNVVLWWCSATYFVLLIIGIGTIIVHLGQA